MSEDFNAAVAQASFKCRICPTITEAGQDFYWDNTDRLKTGNKGQRICIYCYQSKTAGKGSTSPAVSTHPIKPQADSAEVATLRQELDKTQKMVLSLVDKIARLEKGFSEAQEFGKKQLRQDFKESLADAKKDIIALLSKKEVTGGKNEPQST